MVNPIRVGVQNVVGDVFIGLRILTDLPARKPGKLCALLLSGD
jgi:hypothetical protein